MADVFVSYSRADEVRVENLVRALEAHGVSVWWDRSLEQGSGFASLIREEISNSKAVIVCWSEVAAASRWVQSEADEADHQKKYVGVLIALGRAPPPFNTLNNANLQAWSGAADDRHLLALLREVGRRIGRADIAELADAEDRRLADEEKRRKASEEVARARAERERQAAEVAEHERARQAHERATRGARWTRRAIFAGLGLSAVGGGAWMILRPPTDVTMGGMLAGVRPTKLFDLSVSGPAWGAQRASRRADDDSGVMYRSTAFYTPDGSRIVTAFGQMFDSANGRVVGALRACDENGFAFSADAARLAICDDALSIYSARDGGEIAKIDDFAAVRGAFSPNGQRLLVASSSLQVQRNEEDRVPTRGAARIRIVELDAGTGAMTREFYAAEGEQGAIGSAFDAIVTKVEYSRDGKYALAAFQQGEVQIYDLMNGQLLGRLSAANGRPAFTADSSAIICGQRGGGWGVGWFRLPDLQRVDFVPGGLSIVAAPQMERYIVANRGQDDERLFNIVDGRVAGPDLTGWKCKAENTCQIWPLAFSDDGAFLMSQEYSSVFGVGSHIVLRDGASGAALMTIRGDVNVSKLRPFAHAQRRFVMSDASGQAHVWSF